jgi:pimeloyl-ACP methyl ester carboxylesterase
MTVACASVLLRTGPVEAGCTPDEFQGWVRDAARGELRIPRAVERRAQQFRYVFVGGFANERMPGYFSQCRKELLAHGVATGSVHFIFPSSHELFDGNSGAVRSKFLEFAAKGPERLVVIAHSRGACDALAFALRNESFVRDRVEALFLVQGAFGGTGAADNLMGEGPPMDHRMPLRLRAIAYLLGKLEAFLLHRGKHGGLTELTRAQSERFWQRMRDEFADAIPVVGPKTFYVTSQVPPARLRLFRRAIASYLQTYYGPNDGMVLLRDQSLPGLGTCLAVLDAAHTDLTHRSPATRAPRRSRRALVQSIIMAIGGAGDQPSAQ